MSFPALDSLLATVTPEDQVPLLLDFLAPPHPAIVVAPKVAVFANDSFEDLRASFEELYRTPTLMHLERRARLRRPLHDFFRVPDKERARVYAAESLRERVGRSGAVIVVPETARLMPAMMLPPTFAQTFGSEIYQRLHREDPKMSLYLAGLRQRIAAFQSAYVPQPFAANHFFLAHNICKQYQDQVHALRQELGYEGPLPLESGHLTL